MNVIYHMSVAMAEQSFMGERGTEINFVKAFYENTRADVNAKNRHRGTVS